MRRALLIAQKSLPQGFEFHLADAQAPRRSLCGEAVEATQIPPMFFGVESAIEGRWCQRCEALGRQAWAPPVPPPDTGDAPCV